MADECLIIMVTDNRDVKYGPRTAHWAEIKPESVVELDFPVYLPDFHKNGVGDTVRNNKFVLARGRDQRIFRSGYSEWAPVGMLCVGVLMGMSFLAALIWGWAIIGMGLLVLVLGLGAAIGSIITLFVLFRSAGKVTDILQRAFNFCGGRGSGHN